MGGLLTRVLNWLFSVRSTENDSNETKLSSKNITNIVHNDLDKGKDELTYKGNDWTDQTNEIRRSCLFEYEQSQENCVTKNMTSTGSEDFSECSKYQFCDLNLNDFETDVLLLLRNPLSTMQKQTTSTNLHPNNGPSLKLPQPYDRYSHRSINLEMSTDPVDSPKRLHVHNKCLSDYDPSMKPNCRGEIESVAGKLLHEASVQECITAKLNLKELLSHLTVQGLIRDNTHTARSLVASKCNLNRGSFKSMTENEEVEEVNSFNKANGSNCSPRTDNEVLSPRSMSKYVYIRRRNDNKRILKTKGIKKRFRPSQPYLRLCHVTAATDIPPSFTSVLKNKSSKENYLTSKFDDIKHIDIQVESDPETILDHASFNAKEDNLKSEVLVSPRERPITKTKKKYRKKRMKTKCRKKPLLDKTDNDRHEKHYNGNSCAVHTDLEFETETEVKQPFMEYNNSTFESINILTLPAPKLVETLESVLLSKRIDNNLKIYAFDEELTVMKDIKYLHNMKELKDCDTNDMQRVFGNEDLINTDFCSIVQLTTHPVARTLPCRTYAVYPVSELPFDRQEDETEPRVDEGMGNYWNRLLSFRRYTGDGSAVSLARGGFVCEEEGNEVRCHVCHATYSNWQHLDNVEDRHRRLSPNCPLLALVNGATNSPVVQSEAEPNPTIHIAPDLENRPDGEINRYLNPNPSRPLPNAQSHERSYPNNLWENNTVRVTVDENPINYEEIQGNPSVEQPARGAVEHSKWPDGRLTPTRRSGHENHSIPFHERWTGQSRTEGVQQPSSFSYCRLLAPVNGATNSSVVQSEAAPNPASHITPDLENRPDGDINRCLTLPLPNAQSHERRYPNNLRENNTVRVTFDENPINNEEIQGNSSVEQSARGAVEHNIWPDRRLTPTRRSGHENHSIQHHERWTGQSRTEGVQQQSSFSCEIATRLIREPTHNADDSRPNPGETSGDVQTAAVLQNLVQVSDSSLHSSSVCQPNRPNRVCRCSDGQSEIVTSRPEYHQRNRQVYQAVRKELTLSLTGLHGHGTIANRDGVLPRQVHVPELSDTGQTVPDNNQGISMPYNQVGAGSQQAQRTLPDARTLLDENRELRRMLFCKKCKRNETNVMLQPCCHICVCENCAKNIHMCPVCKRGIKNNVKVYRS